MSARSTTGVGPAVLASVGVGSRRAGGFFGVELTLGLAVHDDVTGGVDLMFVYRSW